MVVLSSPSDSFKKFIALCSEILNFGTRYREFIANVYFGGWFVDHNYTCVPYHGSEVGRGYEDDHR